MSDEPLKICPKCGKGVRRLINGGSGVIFKGGGFYVTDKSGKGSGKTQESAKKDKSAESAPCQGCAAAESCPKAANS